MMEYVSGYGWDYRFRIAPSGGAPEVNLKQGATNIPDGGSFNFGWWTVGSNTPITFTIENTGTANLNLSGSPIITITGPMPISSASNNSRRLPFPLPAARRSSSPSIQPQAAAKQLRFRSEIMMPTKILTT